MAAKKIDYPYLPEGQSYKYVSADNPLMAKLKEYARQYSLDKTMPNASLVMKAGKQIAIATNGSDYHEQHGCKRVELGIPTGQGYELCEGCHPKNHSEAKCIDQMVAESIDGTEAEVYLWGHWWCCETCWGKMLQAGIKDIYLLEGSEILFNKNEPGNIVGRQFSF